MKKLLLIPLFSLLFTLAFAQVDESVDPDYDHKVDLVEAPKPPPPMPLHPSEQFAQTITVEDMRKHLTILSSDEYEGRETGAPGNKKAANYIADQFKSFGLPAFNNNSYFQKVGFTKSGWDDIGLTVKGEEFKHLWTFLSFPSQNNNVNLNVKKLYFLGYGIEDEKYNDYANANVKGKVIIVYQGEPRNAAGKSWITNSEEPSEWSTDVKKKLEVAKKHGVAAVLFIEPELQQQLSKARKFLVGPSMALGDPENQGDLPYANSCYIATTIAKKIMGKRFDKVVAAREAITTTGKPKSVKLKTKMQLKMAKNQDMLLGENVMAYIEGSDEKLKKELVVVTAHYDHLGKKGDSIFNGADDNGSGTTTAIEVAQAMTEAKRKGMGPRRSVLVMLVTGEEKGLLGSQYYVEQPVFPLENTIVDINVDMVGRVDDKYQDNPNYVYVIGSDRLSTELHDANEMVNNEYTNLTLDYTYNAEDDPNRYYYRSDHYNFAERGIPAIFFFNGTHADYHMTTDTVEKINFEKMETIGRLVFHLAYELANRDKRIEVDVIGKN